MADGDIGSVKDTLEYDTDQSDYNQILRQNASIAVIFYGDVNSDQKLVTVEVDAAGQITDTVKDTLIFNGVWAGYLSMVKRASGYFVGAGRMDLDSTTYSTWLVSFSVGDAGQLPVAILDSLKVNTESCVDTAIIHLTGNIMVLAYNDNSTHAWLFTFACGSTGAIGGASLDTYEFDPTEGRDIRMIKISDTVVAVVYKDTNADGWVKTFTIDGSGNITEPATDSFRFDAGTVYKPFILHLLGDIYVIAWADSALDGQMITVEIDSSGNITEPIKDSWEYNTTRATGPKILKISDSVIAILYTDTGVDSRIITITIDAAGSITKTAIDDVLAASAPSTFHNYCFMQGNIYLVATQGTDDDGFVMSIDIQTPSLGRPKQLMTIGAG